MDIEEDIKILEKFKNNEMQRDKLERDSRCGGWKIGDIYKKLELNIAIDHILAERKVDKVKIDKLEKINRNLKYLYDDCCKCLVESIDKQKVKEELEKAEKENVPYEEYNKESRAYWINQGRISLAKKLLEEK